jgi:hypothetical protein
MPSLFKSGSAVFCNYGQTGIDLLIPVCLGANEYSFILISVKNYKKQSNESSFVKQKSSATVSGILSKEPEDFTYLILFMDVGADLKPEVSTLGGERCSDRIKAQAQAQDQPPKPEKPEPFVLIIKGLSGENYKILQSESLLKAIKSLAKSWINPIDFVAGKVDQSSFKNVCRFTYDMPDA